MCNKYKDLAGSRQGYLKESGSLDAALYDTVLVLHKRILNESCFHNRWNERNWSGAR